MRSGAAAGVAGVGAADGAARSQPGVIGGLALGAIASAPYSYDGYGPSYGYAPYGYAPPTYYGYYGAPYYGSGYGYYGGQRPW
jgi:hypothetical protein